MIHLTLTTGHSFTVPPDKIDRRLVVPALGPMVAKGGDLIPHFAPWRTVLGCAEGCASFDIRRNKTDMVTFNVVAWTHEGAAAGWPLLEKAYLSSSDQLAKLGALSPYTSAMPEMPDTLPWLATWILPSAVAAANPQELHWMSDFEQCLAAVIIHRRTGRWPFPEPPSKHSF